MSKKKAPAFQFYPTDFLADGNVRLMTLEQIGAYMLLLCHAWTEGGIPTDTTQLSRLLGVTPQKCKSLWKTISPCWERKGDVFVQPRMEKVRDDQEAYREKCRQAGKKSGEARRSRLKLVNGCSLLVALFCQPKVNTPPLPPSPTPVSQSNQQPHLATAWGGPTAAGLADWLGLNFFGGQA